MKKFLIGIILSISGNVYAACTDLYPPHLVIPKLENTVELCNSFFVSIFDTNNRAVIVVSERLTDHDNVGTVNRINAFHADNRLNYKAPVSADYRRSNYDKGHMAPAADAANRAQMYETFLMSNITPQEPTLNRNSWKELEESTRKQFAKVKGDMYILNIAIYHPKAKRIGGGIPVPAGYWKIVYVGNEVRHFYADNKPHAKVKEVSAVNVSRLIKNAQNF